MMATKYSLLAILFSTTTAQAEYRAFMLHQTNAKTKVVRQILTTLDPDQYRTVFPLSPDEKLTYVQTWRCYGRTGGFKPICDKPDKNPGRAPSESPETQPKVIPK